MYFPQCRLLPIQASLGPAFKLGSALLFEHSALLFEQLAQFWVQCQTRVPRASCGRTFRQGRLNFSFGFGRGHLPSVPCFRLDVLKVIDLLCYWEQEGPFNRTSLPLVG